MSSQLLAPPTVIKALTFWSLFRSRVGPDTPGKFAQAACLYCPRQLDFPTTDGGHCVGKCDQKSVPRPACDGTVKPDDFDPKTIVHAACQDGDCGEGLRTFAAVQDPNLHRHRKCICYVFQGCHQHPMKSLSMNVGDVLFVTHFARF